LRGFPFHDQFNSLDEGCGRVCWLQSDGDGWREVGMRRPERGSSRKREREEWKKMILSQQFSHTPKTWSVATLSHSPSHMHPHLLTYLPTIYNLLFSIITLAGRERHTSIH